MTLKEQDKEASRIITDLSKLVGGYVYEGSCSVQACFPLRAGGELRLMLVDDKVGLQVDVYDGVLLPCMTGPSWPTGGSQ